MIFDVSKDVKSSSYAGLCKILSNRVNTTALRTAYHPGETVGYRQISALLEDRLP